MRLLISFHLILSFANFCNAQSTSWRLETDKKVAIKMNDLRSNRTDTIIHYTMQCNGSIAVIEENSCRAQDIQYLIWSDYGVQFMQRFDECKNYKPIKTDRKVLDIISRNYLKIKRENIKPPQFVTIYKGKRELFTQVVDHSCHWMFKILIGKQSVLKDIDNYDLTTDFIKDDGKEKPNINYRSNQRSILKQLTVDVEKVVNNYNLEIGIDK